MNKLLLKVHFFQYNFSLYHIIHKSTHSDLSPSASISTLTPFSLHLRSVGCRPSCPQGCCSVTSSTEAPLSKATEPRYHWPSTGAFALIGCLERGLVALLLPMTLHTSQRFGPALSRTSATHALGA